MDGNTVIDSNLFAFGLSANQQVQNVATYDTGTAADILWRDASTGAVSLWTMNSMTVAGTQTIGVPVQDWWVL